jgi:hypothetical protein
MDFPLEILNSVLFEVVKICELLVAGACEASYILSTKLVEVLMNRYALVTQFCALEFQAADGGQAGFCGILYAEQV